MKQIQMRRFDVRFDYAYEDEVGKLGRTFNFMVDELQDQIHQMNAYISELKAEKLRVQNEQKLKRKAELKALQMQIAPHFLYNTLDSIKWLAEKNDQADISRIATALAAYFRTALSRGAEHITIAEELEHTASYLAIQSMRYGTLFDYTIEAEEAVRPLMTVKLILQPLVENAIYHGIKPSGRSGRIAIVAAAGPRQDIRITVSDNGSGIHPMKLQLIKKRLERSEGVSAEGYGIFNVNDRLKLYFGDDYGLDIHSEWGQGTRVTVRIPMYRKEDVEDV
jgi:two-component system sensor histidine kinase YesM